MMKKLVKQKKADLEKEARDFDLINKERSKNIKSILIDNERLEDYFYKNPWRYDFSRKYAFGNIIEEFKRITNKDGLNILDIGFGNGWFSINANLENKNYWECIDISTEAISTAEIYRNKFAINKNSYYINSLENFKSNKQYDIITCINTLHHLTNLDIFCSKIKKYLSVMFRQIYF